MKILWHSNAPWANSGYGVQTRLFAPRIRDLGHDVAISAFYGVEGNILNWDGMQVYPRAGHPYGQDILPAHASRFQADIVISLIDIWVYNPQAWPNVRFCPWFPVDHEPMPPQVLAVARQAYQPLVYSRFAEEQCKLAGLDCRYVPHGVDTHIYRPMDKATCRGKLGWPTDRTIVGIVAANKDFPCRKSWQQQLDAIAALMRKRDDVLLYAHTFINRDMGGFAIAHYVQTLGIQDRCVFPDQYALITGLNDEYMATVYNGLDFMSNVAMGEGFGVPILEAQACGTPVLVGGWTSMPEITFTEHSLSVPKEDAERHFTQQMSYQFFPRTGPIAERLDWMYEHRPDDAGRRHLAAAARDYDADTVTDLYWRPVLREIEERVSAGMGELQLVTF